jgi:hypothetical protein
MLVTLCFQFDGATINSTACDNIEKEHFCESRLKTYAQMYQADSVEYYLDEPNCDDGWVCTRAYMKFDFPDVIVDSEECQKVLENVFSDDGERISDMVNADSYELYDYS